MSRRILVIGGTRFMGRFLVARCLARGDRVTLFHRGTRPNPFGARVEQLIGDRTSPDFERALSGRTFDAVVDMVGYQGADVERAIDVFAGRVGHYLFVSTGQVYLVRENAPMPSREEDYGGPLMARPQGDDAAQWDYGVGKRACEDALIAARDRLPSTRLRIPMVNGPGDEQQRIARYVRRMLDGGPLRVAFADRRVRHVDAQEVARTIDLLLGDARVLGEAVNQAQDETPTLRELLGLIGHEIGAQPEIVDDESVGTEASPFSTRWMSFLDPAKLRALGVGHAPLSTTIARTVGHVLATL
ncbi:MAG: NAD-dependent epimerase/dehydratase family protein [Deltaproteobacteria bacterium]|nr:NAD-dependent epimerase/dehydratase family protein [Deltaproteobacteria bacterium]